MDLGGLGHGAGGGEARGQPHVLQDEVGGPLHGVVGGARARREVVADAVGRDGEQGQRERLRGRDVRDAHQRREVGLVNVSGRGQMINETFLIQRDKLTK